MPSHHVSDLRHKVDAQEPYTLVQPYRKAWLKEQEDREQSAFWDLKYGMINARQELERIGAFADNWDSYGSPAPGPSTVDAARFLLGVFEEAYIKPNAIAASAEGGTAIYFVRRGRTAYIESNNDGSQVLVMYDHDGNTKVSEVGTDLNIAQVPKTVRDYLG